MSKDVIVVPPQSIIEVVSVVAALAVALCGQVEAEVWHDVSLGFSIESSRVSEQGGY